ncbi:MAG TPA: GntG family PLP-dependent aldolase [Ignavibacteriaceae bacterium]|nr:GntG family PLP-dependent aldolase [Ignavibacteriaceae bacterium]
MPEKKIIDLRSDTVTKPSKEMREAIAAAPVGDDQFGEDPTMNLLQEKTADLLGKERSLWLPSGTMANQAALRSLTKPGDDVIVCRDCHTYINETGASAANSGIQFTEIGAKGFFNLEEFLQAVKPAGHILYPPTTLVEIENTHNRSGGTVFPAEEAVKICKAAKRMGLSSYCDGARLWNAAVAGGKSVKELAEPFDLVAVAFSKGLGAPGGSVLAGSKELIQKVHRYRRMLGGAMRQVGIFAAAGLYALEHNINRLQEDHKNTKMIAECLAGCKKVILDPSAVQTNILIFQLEAGIDANTVVAKAAEKGVLMFALGQKTIRIVTHLDVTAEQCNKAADILTAIINEM